MAEAVPKEEKKQVDEGLERGIQGLTTERIEQVIHRVIDAETGARLKAYVDTCVHCGLCSEACHFFLSHDKDPRFSPVGKVKQTLWEMLRRKGKVSPEFIKQARIVSSTECNLCKRCAMYCPFGIDIAYLMLVVRRICHLLGVTPLYIQDTAHSHSVTTNQMWVKEDEWIDTLQWQEEEARDEIPNLQDPARKGRGRDHVLGHRAGAQVPGPADLPGGRHHERGRDLDWTMPATPGWDNSDMAMYTGDNEMMGRIKRAHFETAMRLKVKKIVMGECGHAFRSVYDVGNRWLGWRMPPDSHRPCHRILLRAAPERPDQSVQKVRRAGDPARPLQRGARRRPARNGPLRRQRHLRKFHRNAPQPGAQLLLFRRRRGHQLRPALQDETRDRQPRQGRTALCGQDARAPRS